MKPFTFYALLLSLFTSFFGFSQIDSTLLEKIKNHDTVYVFIEHGKIKSEQYNYTFGKVAVYENESKPAPVERFFPSEIDSLSDSILLDLNDQFKAITTTKFVYIGSGTHEEIIEKYKANNLEIALVFRYIGEYGYDYMKPFSRLKPEDPSSELVSFRDYTTHIFLEIYQFDDKNKFAKMESVIQAARSSSYKEIGYTNNVNVHFKEFHPMQLKNETFKGSISCTERIIEKLNSEQEKADKKRAKKSK